MPRDSSGNYTLPIGNPVIDGTIIDTNWANPTMADIAIQLNNVLTRDGLLSPVGPMYFVDGTPALPGIAFAAAHGTGFWRDAIQMGVSWQGDPKMLWGASGARTVGNLTVTGDLAVTGVGPYVLKAGDTMIGPLTVNTAAGAVVQLALTSNDPISGGIFFRQAAALRGIIGFGAGYLPPSAGPSDFGVRSEAALLFSAGSVERMRIDAAGDIGIGTSSIVLSGANRRVLAMQASEFTALEFQGPGNGLRGYVNCSVGALELLHTTALQFVTSSIVRAKIDAAGNVLIGKAAIGFSNTVGQYFTPDGNRVAENGGLCMQVNRLGSDGGIVAFYRQAVAVGDISVSATGTLYSTISDHRLKSAVVDLSDSGTFIDSLQPRSWAWADGKAGVGFVAHELAGVSPGSVSGEKDAVDANGKPVLQMLDASTPEMIANIVAELQSLRQRVVALGG